MKKWIYTLALAILCCISCEKDNILVDQQTLSASVAEKENNLIKALGSAPNGWVMMVKSNGRTVPLVLKFDTAKNIVRIKTTYRTQSDDRSTYLVNRGTGGVILNFSSGSVISSLMRQGPNYSDLTDYQFNVLNSTTDSVSLQCIRSGSAYGQEGGAVYKLFKTPASWTWADDDLKFDLRLKVNEDKTKNKIGQLKLKYLDTGKELNLWLYHIIDSFPGFLFSDPFYSDASSRIFDPYFRYSILFAELNSTGELVPIRTYTAIQGHNSINFKENYNVEFYEKFKFDYLVYKSIKQEKDKLSIQVAAYDETGKENITGEYTIELK
ncbi:hypothetical protein BWD42_07070 [Sphingobacterium sp. CZ-UAM]|uniref:DUF4302 domain-containing protein n=1 Tax=Sphingobacterium sp. CZ-UAM TaxID=1933868 RepID=UPI0009843E86|nr:DUF4302 domain-containing protein [Sphingobacterium sp. CZ-UAM]OOG19666.1 hypothetical protein BWD42_07070 [Sphingobacterium sp. CZ-UAM]